MDLIEAFTGQVIEGEHVYRGPDALSHQFYVSVLDATGLKPRKTVLVNDETTGNHLVTDQDGNQLTSIFLNALEHPFATHQ